MALIRAVCASRLASACIATVYRRLHLKKLLPHLVLRLHTFMAARLLHHSYAVARCLRRSARARVQRRDFVRIFRLIMIVRLQCALRSHVARSRLRLLQLLRHRQRVANQVRAEVAAAAILSSAWMSRRLRCCARLELRRRRAVVTIASAWRIHQGKKCFSGLNALVLRRVSARTIQGAFRCRSSRRCLHARLMQKCRAAAAKTVQMAWRGVVALRVLSERYLRRLQSVAVVDLQCAARAWAARRCLRARTEAISRSVFLRCLQRRRCQVLHLKQMGALLLSRFLASHFNRKSYSRKVFLRGCHHTILQTAELRLQRRALLFLRTSSALCRLSAFCAASQAQRSFARTVAAHHVTLFCQRYIARAQHARSAAAQAIASQVAALDPRRQLKRLRAQCRIGYGVLAAMKRAHWAAAWRSTRARRIQHWWKFSRVRHFLGFLLCRLKFSQLLLNWIVRRRCVIFRRKLAAASQLQRFIVSKCHHRVALQVFACSVLQRRIRSFLSRCSLVRGASARRLASSISTSLSRRSFLADADQQRACAAAVVLAAHCAAQLRQEEFRSTLALYRRRAAADAMSSSPAFHANARCCPASAPLPRRGSRLR